MPANPRPNNPDSACRYCRVHSVGTPAADELVCVCEVFCGAGRCSHHPNNLVEPPTRPAATTDQHDDPYGPPLTDPHDDRVKRWRPHPRAEQHARALLRADGEADCAVIPMFQPGKIEGIWGSGQAVHTVFGVVLLSVNTFEPTGKIPSHSWARNTAAAIAAARLRTYATAHPDVRDEHGGIGTVGWATVDRRSLHVPVHEDGSPDERHVLD